MEKHLRFLLPTLIIISLFLVNYIPHHNQMPMHVDSWQVISRADFVIKSEKLEFIEPFSNTYSSYPLGAHLSLAVISSITGLNMIFLAQLLPGIFFALLGLLLYSVSKALFNNKLAAIAVMAFTPLAFSSITMLGPFYIVPVAWGMLLSLVFFYFILKDKWKIAFLIFIAIALTHRSSMVFALVGLGLYMILNKKNWKKLKYLLIIITTSLIIFLASGGTKLFYSIMKNLFIFQKSKPYISVYLTLPFIFIILLAIGFYLITLKEKKASKFLIPLFSIMAINAFIYWKWQGFFLVYRRLFTFTFMLMPFFVGYAVYTISTKKIKFVKNQNIILIILLLLLVPFAIKANVKSNKYNYVYVDMDEAVLFSEFGRLHPNSYLGTDHLEAFAMPYYNIKPIQLSPAHGVNTTYFYYLAPCYLNKIPECFGDFFYATNFTYLYPGKKINTTYFNPILKYKNKEIYKFNREKYREHIKNKFNRTI